MTSRKSAETRLDLGFLIHAGTYVLVNAGLAALNLKRNPNHLWFPWVAGGWGAGVAMHGAMAYLPAAREMIVERKAARIEKRTKRRAQQKKGVVTAHHKNRIAANGRHKAAAK